MFFLLGGNLFWTTRMSFLGLLKKVEHVFVHLYIKHNYIIKVANGHAVRLKRGVVKLIWDLLKMIRFCYTAIFDKFRVLNVIFMDWLDILDARYAKVIAVVLNKYDAPVQPYNTFRHTSLAYTFLPKIIFTSNVTWI